MNADVIVIGGGMVGAAIAYGLANRNVRVLVLDGNDTDYRAAHANFGLVWQHGKGMGMPGYESWTRSSVELWPAFAEELSSVASVDLQYEQKGGLTFCLGEDEFEARLTSLMRLHNQPGGGDRDWEMIDRVALERMLPGVRLGAEITGASYGHRDGHANPLRLLAALHAGILRKGGRIFGRSTVQALRYVGGSFVVECGHEQFSAARVVIAAGLGTERLAAQVGLDIPTRPQRGQILVTERVQPFLPFPTFNIRQTREGTVMIGSTNEETGLDNSTTTAAASDISANAIRELPDLRNVKLVRQWAGLRILTPDNHPVYAESATAPGAFVAQCHSGVTLAAAHAAQFAEAVIAGKLPQSFEPFHHRRFDVPQAA